MIKSQINNASIKRFEILLKVIEVIVFCISQLFKTKYNGLYIILQNVQINTIVSTIITKVEFGSK